METKESTTQELSIVNNVSVKNHPLTTYPGIAFIFISIGMYFIKFILPAFMTLKKEIPYSWWEPLAPLGLGILLIYMSDKIFERIFNRADRVVSKVTHTEETITTDTKV